MGLNVNEVSRAQVESAGAKPLCASRGPTAYDQLLQRMRDEAVSDTSDVCKLKHLLAAIATSPHGRATVQFLDLLRDSGIPDQELRKLLGLSNSTTVINTAADLGSSVAVQWVIKEAIRIPWCIGRRPETSDVLDALIRYFKRSDEQGVEHAEIRLISAIKDGSIKDL